MEEVKIQIECLESEMQSLTNKVISLLNQWSNKRQQLIALQECLYAIVNNARS